MKSRRYGHVLVTLSRATFVVAGATIVSPDGQWVAYVITNGDESAVQGTVTVSRLGGGDL